MAATKARPQLQPGALPGCLSLLVIAGVGAWVVNTCGAEPDAAATPTPEPPPCSGVPLRETVEVYLCGETGEGGVEVAMRSANGAQAGTVRAGAAVKVIDTPSVRRSPGHVDAHVCIASGERAGAIGYVANTQIFGRECSAPTQQQPPPAHTPGVCRISKPGTQGDVNVFPTEEGLSEYLRAAASNDKTAANVASVAARPFTVRRGTGCTYLEQGPSKTKVRITDGWKAMAEGWLPTEWTRGE